MRTNIVLTLTGTDRVGIVDEVTQFLLDLNGNIDTSRMSRLGGEFAILMLVSLPSDRIARLEQEIPRLLARGYKVTATPTAQTYAQAHAGWLPYQIEVFGADHEGIIHEIAHTLSQSGISIETMETDTTRAPISGSPMFSMTALVVAPPHLPEPVWMKALADAGHHLHVDIKASPAPRQ